MEGQGVWQEPDDCLKLNVLRRRRRVVCDGIWGKKKNGFGGIARWDVRKKRNVPDGCKEKNVPDGI